MRLNPDDPVILSQYDLERLVNFGASRWHTRDGELYCGTWEVDLVIHNNTLPGYASYLLDEGDLRVFLGKFPNGTDIYSEQWYGDLTNRDEIDNHLKDKGIIR